MWFKGEFKNRIWRVFANCGAVSRVKPATSAYYNSSASPCLSHFSHSRPLFHHAMFYRWTCRQCCPCRRTGVALPFFAIRSRTFFFAQRHILRINDYARYLRLICLEGDFNVCRAWGLYGRRVIASYMDSITTLRPWSAVHFSWSHWCRYCSPGFRSPRRNQSLYIFRPTAFAQKPCFSNFGWLPSCAVSRRLQFVSHRIAQGKANYRGKCGGYVCVCWWPCCSLFIIWIFGAQWHMPRQQCVFLFPHLRNAFWVRYRGYIFRYRQRFSCGPIATSPVVYPSFVGCRYVGILHRVQFWLFRSIEHSRQLPQWNDNRVKPSRWSCD